MPIDRKKCISLSDKYPEIRECISQSKTFTDALPSYEYLFSKKDSIPKELYAFYFRKLLQMNTANVSDEMRLKMFEGVDREDIMYQDELDAIENEFGDSITIYRGAQKSELKPGICWTKNREVAEEFASNTGKIFVTEIPKTSILLYFAHEESEGEIIANVTSGYKLLERDN